MSKMYTPSVLPLVSYPDIPLKTKLQPVYDGMDVRRIAADMTATMLHHKGIGLAANQVGYEHRLIVVHVPEAQATTSEPHALGFTVNPIVMVNPEVTRQYDKPQPMRESCLSDPGFSRVVKRHESIWVKYTTVDGEQAAGRFCGLLARAIQHEIDHLDGVNLRDWAPSRIRVIARGSEVKP